MAGTNRTPTGTKTVRCKATEGAQQCLKAEHPKIQNHTWGVRGETPQWRADGTPKPDRDHTDQLPRIPEGGFVDVPESPMDAAAMQTPASHDPAPDGSYFSDPPDPVMERDLQDMEQARQEAREPQRGNTQQAREWLANQPPTGPLLGDVQEQARSQGKVKPKETTEDDRRDMERHRGHRHLIQSDGPRPVSVSGAPGSRLSDVASRVIHLTMDGYPAEVHDEVIWTEIATHALVSMREEQARTKQPADGALVAAALDAILHVAKARGLA
jgi:hypothetical protein